MKQLYVFGGQSGYGAYTLLKTCAIFDTITSEWSSIANMNLYRDSAACTVYEGKIVACGGYERRSMQTVEAYDHRENKWMFLPDMINGRALHAAVSMDNNMFVVGGNWKLSCEVFDSITRRFTNIKEMILSCSTKLDRTSVLSIGNKLLVFPRIYRSVNGNVHVYDVLKNEWYVEDNYLEELTYVISCSRMAVV